MKSIATVILNWNGWRDTVECLETLYRLDVTGYMLQVIVVDNGSTDESVEKLKAQISKLKSTTQNLKLKLIENKENLGFAEGNNVGIKYALNQSADYVMLLNNDTLIAKDLVEGLIAAAEKDKKIGILGPKVYFAPGFEFHKNRYRKEDQGKVIWYAGGKIDWENVYCFHRGVDAVDKGQYERAVETDFVSGCCMMVKAQVFKNIGFLDKKYFLYLEDVDFCLRAKEAGFKIVYTPKGHLWHKNASSTGRPGSDVHLYYQTRNRLLLALRFASLRTKLALFRESTKFILKDGIKRKACLDFYLRRFGGRDVS